MVNRIVTGAHYGLRDWLIQRLSAVLMAAELESGRGLGEVDGMPQPVRAGALRRAAADAARESAGRTPRGSIVGRGKAAGAEGDENV